MRPMQFYMFLVMFIARQALTFPTKEPTGYYTMDGRQCKMCPPGEFQKSCTECEPCPVGSYTHETNREDSCHFCYGDCRPEYHLKVEQNCTSTSDMKCVCEAGFTCTDKDLLSENCKYCSKETTTATTTATTTTGSTQRWDQVTHVQVSNQMSGQLAAILCPLALGCVGLVTLLFICRPRDESCFKQALAWLVCNQGGRAVADKPKESTHQSPRDSFSAKQQPPSLPVANLGPVHVHNPGTVIVSLLSQFTGQVGPTIEGGKNPGRESGEEEEDKRDCPVYHPTSSPSIHLSEEERNGETDSIFFPSQEQGKDCHVSKEEVL